MTKPQASPKSLKPPEKGEAGAVEWKCECPCADERRDVQRKAQSEEVEPQTQCEKSWDRFNIRPDIDEEESSTRGLRVLRFILLTLLFLAVFGTAVLSKLSLVYLAEMKRVARQAGELDQNQFYSWVLAFVLVLPNIFSSIRCGLRLAFKNSDVSNRKMIALVRFRETKTDRGHGKGAVLKLLCQRVLPTCPRCKPMSNLSYISIERLLPMHSMM
ncbi:uncharacterized protein LOC142923057 [Petromyzon marinus]|uniref:uncharacterized protein LOC142923057 n=1 Tax=Petromyzon marinus TaxID=7757 RepID=UPI003F71CD21